MSGLTGRRIGVSHPPGPRAAAETVVLGDHRRRAATLQRSLTAADDLAAARPSARPLNDGGNPTCGRPACRPGGRPPAHRRCPRSRQSGSASSAPRRLVRSRVLRALPGEAPAWRTLRASPPARARSIRSAWASSQSSFDRAAALLDRSRHRKPGLGAVRNIRVVGPGARAVVPVPWRRLDVPLGWLGVDRWWVIRVCGGIPERLRSDEHAWAHETVVEMLEVFKPLVAAEVFEMLVAAVVATDVPAAPVPAAPSGLGGHGRDRHDRQCQDQPAHHLPPPRSYLSTPLLRRSGWPRRCLPGSPSGGGSYFLIWFSWSSHVAWPPRRPRHRQPRRRFDRLRRGAHADSCRLRVSRETVWPASEEHGRARASGSTDGATECGSRGQDLRRDRRT